MVRFSAYIALLLLLASCSSTRKLADPEKKFTPDELQNDYQIFRGALEDAHPGLYAFTPRDSMNFLFDQGLANLQDSMSERQFRTHLLKITAAIRCGHTSVNYSKRYIRHLDTARLNLFPLSFKVWKDSLVVTRNLHRKDSVLSRGTIITSINNRPAEQLIDSLVQYVTGDGFSATGRYQSLSAFGAFGVLYKNVFGLSDSFSIGYIDREGFPATTRIAVYRPRLDSLVRADSLTTEPVSRRRKKNQRSLATRNLQVDTTLRSAYMTLHSFARGSGLKKFFRQSFRDIQRLQLQHLVIDVRLNGGGHAGNSTALTRYLSDHSFILADSLYALHRSAKYSRHIRLQPVYWLMSLFITRKHTDGYFHFGYFERKRYFPYRKNHFNGKVYLLTGGHSFSATTLFAQQLKGQENITLVGEETGGGAYGNNAWIIPEYRLPRTGLRLGIPKFRFVMQPELLPEGRGVLPDLEVSPTSADIRMGVDVKLEAVRSLIESPPTGQRPR